MKQREIHLKMCLRYLPQMLLKWSNLLGMNKNTLFEECPRDSNMNVNSISSLAYKENLLQLKGNQLLLYPKRKLCFYLQLCTECLSMHLQHIAGPYLSQKNYQNPGENCQKHFFQKWHYEQAKYLMTQQLHIFLHHVLEHLLILIRNIEQLLSLTFLVGFHYLNLKSYVQLLFISNYFSNTYLNSNFCQLFLNTTWIFFS